MIAWPQGGEPGEAVARHGMLALGADELVRAVGRLTESDAVALHALAEPVRAALDRRADSLPFRPARAVVGEGDRIVRQDFEVSLGAEAERAFAHVARALERLLNLSLEKVAPPPLAGRLRLNDIVVQRYGPGSLGITPHRDHARYVGLVAILVLSGRGRFFVCADRSGRHAREVSAAAGDLILMRAPGLWGRSDRPFHFLADVTERRYSLGLREDSRRP